MYQASHHELDRRLDQSFDRVGLIGQRLRQGLRHDLKAKIVLRRGRDPVEIVGVAGAGKHKVVEAAHAVAEDLLGRRGARVNLDCGSFDRDADLEGALDGAMLDAQGGTLVLDRFGTLTAEQRRSVMRLTERGRRDNLVLRVRSGAREERTPGTTIEVTPLHAREEDIWELVDHFFAATVEDCDATGCRGFSRQAKADIAEVIRDRSLKSVRRLRDIVRDLVFDAFAAGPLPLKLTSDHVRVYLEQHFGQTAENRRERDRALIESQFDDLVHQGMVDRLAEIHGVPAELLEKQAQVIKEIVGYIGDMPRSYRNIMDKTDDIERAALWLVSGATTQAEFRRYFGDERFMRPTKSVAWAFYNRVFKRDM